MPGGEPLECDAGAEKKIQQNPTRGWRFKFTTFSVEASFGDDSFIVRYSLLSFRLVLPTMACMHESDSAPITQLLGQWRRGDAGALDRLVPLVYGDLRQLAQRHLRGEGAITLNATELVHEACLRLIGPALDWQDRAHFFAIAARQMRHVLVDHARHKQRDKRGGGLAAVTLQADDAEDNQAPPDVVALDQLLTRLGEVDARKRDVLELHYFGGLSYLEMSHVLNVSEATVDRDLRFAKAWLRQALQA